MPEINGLEMLSLQSEVMPFSKESDFYGLIKKYWDKEEGYFVAYLVYKVLIGKYRDGKFIASNGETFQPKHIQRIRLFNEDKELYLWRKDENIFSGRLRSDRVGTNMDVVDAWQVLCGTRCSQNGDGFTNLSEDRGTNLVLPFMVNETDLPIRLHTRNYISYNEFGQAGYEDCRFVAFTDREGTPLQEVG